MKKCLRTSNITLVFLLMVLTFVLTLYTCKDVQAYEDSECLVCHKDYGRSAETIPENVSILYVDQEKWEQDIHYEVVGLSCDDCHLDATPDTHPQEGLDKVNCGECHEEEADSYYQTPHWTAEVEEGKQKPDCADCHTPHDTRAKDDPESTVFKGNIKAICLSCHQEREPSTTLFNRLAVFRISAHRKSDISNRFDFSECINCHYTQAIGHGENPVTETHCGKCHSLDAKAGKIVFGPFHLDPSWENQPLVFSVEVLNILIILGVIIALVIWIVRGFLKSKDDKATQQPEG
jgi:predicted CXXCH cytochrome family protein